MITEIIASCEPKSCYVDCRMRQVGGGRCTKGGCMCYVAWTKPDGSPFGMTYREDAIWYTLSKEEQDRIRMAKWRPGPTARPTYAPSTRPTYAPTTRPTYAPTTTEAVTIPSTRPTFAPTTTQPTARPN